MSNGHRGRGQRQRKHWHDLEGARGTFVADAIILMATFASEAGDPYTVLRMFGEYAIAPTTAPVATDSCLITLGVGVVSTDAATLGGTAMPDPEDEPDYPWLYWMSHALHFPTTSVDPSVASGSVRKSFDVGSMRKVAPRQSLVVVAQYSDIIGTPPITVTMGSFRFLVGE